jgi:hypothetical protein
MDAAKEILGGPSGWAIKDPRFVLTFHRWEALFLEKNVLLVLLEKDYKEMTQSYLSRGEVNADGVPSAFGHKVLDLKVIARGVYNKWTGEKFCISYEDVDAALGLWKTKNERKYGKHTCISQSNKEETKEEK